MPTYTLSSAQTSLLPTIPELAVNFGDPRGNTVGRTLAVDQYGYIYVHGYTDSDAFNGENQVENGGNRKYSWVHGKTHWEMAAEL